MTDLADRLLPLFGIGQAAGWATFLVFLRVGAAMALIPAFGEQMVPLRVRLVLTLAFTAIVTPAVAGSMPAPAAASTATLAMAVETLAGLVIGIGLRLFVLGLQTAATIVANATSLSQVFGGMGMDPQPAVGQILTMAALALAVTLGLHVRVAEVLILSYDAMPPGRFPDAGDLTSWGIGQVARTFALGFSLAAPFAIAATLYNAALGVINRAMPQLMVAFVGAPALTLGGLALMVIVLPLMLALWMRAFAVFLDTPFAVP